jgi:hypothetical protein
MPSDHDELRTLNIAIGDAEFRGDVEYLRAIIAPELAFARADGRTVDNRQRFLEKVSEGDARDTTFAPDSIEVLGNRAIVKCTVIVRRPDGAKSFDNVRLFVRLDGAWRLLAWANEPSSG